jgi:hypothetical protein
MAPADLLSSLVDAGLTVNRDGGTLLVSPAGKITPELRQQIVANRDALLALLGVEGGSAASPFDPSLDAAILSRLKAGWWDHGRRRRTVVIGAVIPLGTSVGAVSDPAAGGR